MIEAESLAEYRKERKVVLLEQVKSDWRDVYRLTVCQRLPNREAAAARFLDELPPRERKRFANLKAQLKRI